MQALNARGDQVVSLGRSTGDNFRCDLGDAEALSSVIQKIRPTKVIHLAAIASVVRTSSNDYFGTNVRGTENLLRACSSLPSPPAVAIASSANVYGRHDVPVNEGMATLPISEYGRSKLSMETMAGHWTNRLPILITRPFNYTGPGQSEEYLVAKIAACFLRREPRISLGNLEVVRDFSDVRDIAEDYLRLMDRPVQSHEIVNLCSGVGVSVAELIQICVDLTGQQPEVSQNPELMRSAEIPMLVGDPSLLIRLSGRAHARSLRLTLRDMLDQASVASPPAFR